MVRRLVDPNPSEADGYAGDDFAASRKPLEARFLVDGAVVTVINNHLNSKGGDNALFGNVQPPVLVTEAQRLEQARIINARVDELLAADPDANIIVAGDLNDFAYSAPVRAIMGADDGSNILTDLVETLLPANERYSYNFQGSAQSLDHVLASNSLMADGTTQVDIVRINSELATGASDHDPIVARFDLRGTAEMLAGEAGNDVLLGYAGDDSLLGADGMDTLSGGTGDDSLAGGAAADNLSGGDGADTIDGGAGRDYIAGGAGADMILLGRGAVDVVRGFETGLDTFLFSAGLFGVAFAEGALEAARFEANISGQASAAGGTLVFETDTSRLWWDTDGAARGRELIATVSAPTGVLTVDDFLVIA